MSKKDVMQNKINALLSKKQADIGTVIERIQATGSMIDDYVINVDKLEFASNDRVTVRFPDHRGKPVETTIHDHAFHHFGGKFGIPEGYLRNMAHGDPWQRQVAAYTLNEFAANDKRDRFLLRTVNGQTRAALSDKYRRLNSAQIGLSFLVAANEMGAQLVDWHSGETRNFLEVIHPEVLEVETVNNGIEYFVLGSRYQNSDFGHGALELRQYLLKCVCLNGMIREKMLREVHKGAAIAEGFIVSEETIVKDTELRVSLVKDAMRSMVSPENKLALVEAIQGASAELVDIQRETEKLPKLGVTGAEIDALKTLLMNNSPKDGLEGEPTKWKFVNAVTALARDSEPERKRDLEKIAGDLVTA